MVKSLPFPAIKAAVTIEQVAKFSGVKFTREHTTLRAVCPVHGGHDRSLTVTPGKLDDKNEPGVYFCSASKEGGDRIALYAHIKGIKQYQAHLEIAKAFAPHLIDGEPTVQTVPEEKDERSGERGFKPLPYIEPENPAVLALGISPEVATATGLGFCPRGVHRGRIAIPLRLADGSIAGYLSITADTSVQLPPRWFL